MSRMPDDSEISALLQQGLKRIPVPEPSASFDAGVRARLRRRESPWQIFWNLARPVLVPAGCSLVITLAVLKVTSVPASVGGPQSQMQPAGNIALEPRSGRMRSLEQRLERIDRDTPSLGGFGALRRADRFEREPTPQPPNHRGTSGRRADRTEWMQG
jgi:hypothetical protein